MVYSDALPAPLLLSSGAVLHVCYCLPGHSGLVLILKFFVSFSSLFSSICNPN